MSVLFRYVARDFFRNWLATLTALVMLIVIAALFGNIDEAFSSWEAFQEFLDKTVRTLPGLVESLLPMTVLLATVLTFSALSRTSELVAMKASGMGLFRLMLPLFSVLLLISTLAYLNQNYLYRHLHPDEEANSRISTHQWRTLGSAIIYMDFADLKDKTLSGVRAFVWREGPFELTQVNSLPSGRRDGQERWEFSDTIEREYGSGGWSLRQNARKELAPNEFPDVFKPAELDAHHTPFLDLYQEIKQRESQGLRVEVYWMEWLQKVAAVVAPFLMVLIGTPLSQFHFRRARVAGELAITLLTGLLFMVGTQILYTLGKGGFVGPALSAWSINVAFALLAAGLLRMAR
jgi:LPS export ABC transporter permease LptG